MHNICRGAACCSRKGKVRLLNLTETPIAYTNYAMYHMNTFCYADIRCDFVAN